MNKIKQFFYQYRIEITWFLIGFLVMSGLQDLSTGNYIGALVAFGLAYINYKLK
jgi:hypothetical protein